MTIWRLKKGADRRVRQGHPWVFTSELAHSAKEIAPGEVVELRDAQDHFLAFGYGHPTSQICFRKLTSRSKESDVLTVDFFRRRLLGARELRRASGWTAFSHRWLFAEADGVPGLIVDVFCLAPGRWCAVVQSSTAGIEHAKEALFEALRGFSPEFGELMIVDAPTSRTRALEGLSVGEKRVVDGTAELGAEEILLHAGVRLRCDLLRGQKTGFFLDQQWNAFLLRELLRQQAVTGPVRVLDICCYVGQWAAHVTHALRARGAHVEVTLVDVSEAALKLAEYNVRALGAADVNAVAGDALDGLDALGEGEYDVVICDPPAFVKKKADLEPGLRAYTKLNRDALKRARLGGLFVASSCSGLVKSADYQGVLRAAGQKSGRQFKQIVTGGHGPDHPVRPEFPEGEYLKCWIGRTDLPF